MALTWSSMASHKRGGQMERIHCSGRRIKHHQLVLVRDLTEPPLLRGVRGQSSSLADGSEEWCGGEVAEECPECLGAPTGNEDDDEIDGGNNSFCGSFDMGDNDMTYSSIEYQKPTKPRVFLHDDVQQPMQHRRSRGARPRRSWAARQSWALAERRQEEQRSRGAEGQIQHRRRRSWAARQSWAPSGDLQYQREKKAATAGDLLGKIGGEMGGEVLAGEPQFEFLGKTRCGDDDLVAIQIRGSDVISLLFTWSEGFLKRPIFWNGGST